MWVKVKNNFLYHLKVNKKRINIPTFHCLKVYPRPQKTSNLSLRILLYWCLDWLPYSTLILLNFKQYEIVVENIFVCSWRDLAGRAKILNLSKVVLDINTKILSVVNLSNIHFGQKIKVIGAKNSNFLPKVFKTSKGRGRPNF